MYDNYALVCFNIELRSSKRDKARDKAFEGVKQQYTAFAIKVVCKLSSWAIAKRSELKHYCESSYQK